MAQEARHYEKLADGAVRCWLCPHRCRIAAGEVGLCRVRRNEAGTLLSLIYGEVTSVAVDPIEKKPLYHFYPGSGILSLGTIGCNFSCLFCQNWQTSQTQAPTSPFAAEEAVRQAQATGSIGIAYTYNEPNIWFEYVLDTATLAQQAGLKNVLVTNGYIAAEPLAELLPVIDALNIDLKSMDRDFYLKLCGGRLEPVLETAKRASRGALVEVTHLVIPGHNDADDQFRRMADWVAGELGPDTPAHISAYSPRYRLQAPPTPLETLQRAYHIFSDRLNYVYLGNVMVQEGSNTRCAHCGALAIERLGYHTTNHLRPGARCPDCDRRLPVIMVGNDPLATRENTVNTEKGVGT